MAASGKRAISVCQAAISAGNHSVPIYFQLGSQLHLAGQSEQALSTINRGLSRFNGNKLLSDLRNRIAIDIQEQRDLNNAGKRNTSVMSQAQLKMTCLTKSGTEGLTACGDYLSKTDKDGDKIRKRRDELQAGIADTTANEEIQQAEVPQPGPSAPTTTADTANTPSAGDIARARARTVLVRNTQELLTDLGLSPGAADGKSGPNTRRAVREFRQRAGLAVSDTINAQLLADLDQAALQLNAAQATLQQSREASAGGDAETALALLDNAAAASPFLSVPPGYRKNIEISLAARTTAPQTPAPGNTTGATTSTTPGTVAGADTPQQPTAPTQPQQPNAVAKTTTPTQPTPAATPSTALNEVLAQIERQKSRLQVQRSNNARQISSLRSRVASALVK